MGNLLLNSLLGIKLQKLIIQFSKQAFNLFPLIIIHSFFWFDTLDLEVSCKEDQITTDRQTVNYYSTIHPMELIYFDSNTQLTTKTNLKS